MIQLPGIRDVVFFVFGFLIKKTSEMSPSEARQILETYSPKPTGKSVLSEKRISFDDKFDLTIIVPVYNTAQWLEDCIGSILEQETNYSFSLILIDDGSTDSSSELIEQYADKESVYVIHQENQGVSVARNRGIDYARGKYLLFVDSDDMLLPGCVEDMINAAKECDADVVEASFRSERIDSLQGCRERAPMKPSGFPCGKVIKRELFDYLQFPEGYWYEDTIVEFLLLPQSRKTVILPEIYYFYRKNESGATSRTPYTRKAIDTIWITELMDHEREMLGLPDDQQYIELLLRQTCINYYRTITAPDAVKEAVFVLSNELFHERFRENEHRNNALIRTILARDYGKYCLYMKTHRHV